MSGPLEIVAVIGIAGYVIGRQLIGEPLRGKRVVLLPAVLAVIGIVNLSKGSPTVSPADVTLLVIGAVIALSIGLGQGAMMRLENRGGGLWGQMPKQSLWLWLILVISRLGLTLAAHGLGASLAASSSTILLMLGINRLGQAAVVVLRAMQSGTSFTPEKDGSTFMAGLTR